MAEDSFKPKLAKSKKWLLFEKKEGNVYCIGDETTGNFVKVPEEDLSVIEEITKYFDGQHTIQWIHEHLLTTMELDVPVDSVFETFKKANLIENSPSENVDEFQTTSTILTRRKLTFFDEAANLSSKVFYPLFYSTAIILFVALVFFFINFGGFMQVFSEVWTGFGGVTLGMIISIVIAYLCALIHELGHLLVGWFFGTPPRELRVMMYLGIFPTLFLDIPNIYTLPRRRRIIIAVAGVYVNLVISAVAMIAIFAFKLAPIAQLLLGDIALMNIFTFILILNPFVPGDGYFLAVNILKTPNIRRHSFERLRGAFKMSWSKQDALFICYALASLLISAYICYYFAVWFLSSVRETYASLYRLLTTIDFLAAAFKVSFIGFILYSAVKTAVSFLRRMTASKKSN